MSDWNWRAGRIECKRKRRGSQQLQADRLTSILQIIGDLAYHRPGDLTVNKEGVMQDVRQDFGVVAACTFILVRSYFSACRLYAWFCPKTHSGSLTTRQAGRVDRLYIYLCSTTEVCLCSSDLRTRDPPASTFVPISLVTLRMLFPTSTRPF